MDTQIMRVVEDPMGSPVRCLEGASRTTQDTGRASRAFVLHKAGPAEKKSGADQQGLSAKQVKRPYVPVQKRQEDRCPMEEVVRTAGTRSRLSMKVSNRARTSRVKRSAQSPGRADQPHSNRDSSHRTMCSKRKTGTANRHMWKI